MGKDDKKLSKYFKIYLLIFLALMIVFINPVSKRNILNFFDIFNRPEKELKLVNEFNIDKQAKSIDIFEEKIINWRDNRLYFLDFNGFEILNKDFEFKNPSIVFGEDFIYIMDKDSGNIYIMDKHGETIERIDLKSPFHNLKEEGDYLHIYKKDEDKEIVDIIDRKGNILIRHEENIPILTVASENKNKKYVISTLDIDKELKSIVSIYSLDGNSIQDIELKDEIVVYTKLIKNNILIVSESKIHVFVDGKEKWSKKIENLKDVKMLNNNICILYNNKFETLSLRGNIIEETNLTLNLEKIGFVEDNILLYGKRNIVMPQNRKNILNFKTKEDIMNLKYNSGNLLIQKQAKIEIYNINKKGDNK